jgi:hypothetical protein
MSTARKGRRTAASPISVATQRAIVQHELERVRTDAGLSTTRRDAAFATLSRKLEALSEGPSAVALREHASAAIATLIKARASASGAAPLVAAANRALSATREFSELIDALHGG